MTSTDLYYIVGLAILVLFTLLVLRHQDRKQTKQMVAEFPVKFPGRCMICSYHRYGVEYGFTVKPLEPHDCIEKVHDDTDEMRNLQKDSKHGL